MRVSVRAKEGLYPVDDLNDPVEPTVILGDDASAAAGKRGRSAYTVGRCTENEPGTVLKCKRARGMTVTLVAALGIRLVAHGTVVR